MKNYAYPLTFRAFVVGIVGLVIITLSSMYVALRMGALPWPTVFVTVLSMAVLSRFRNSNLNEINCCHTLMSAGAMVSGGLAFTIPGLWILDKRADLPISEVMVIAIVGALLGTLFTSLIRKKLIEKEQLPYPMGVASYETLTSVDDSKSALKLFSAMGFSSLFTFFRDFLSAIPQTLQVFPSFGPFQALSVWTSPMALGIGAMIGPVLAGVWFLGMVIGYYILVPIGSLFASVDYLNALRNDLGIGLMVGTGVGVFLKAVLSILKKVGKGSAGFDKKNILTILLPMLLSVVVLSLLTELTTLEALLMMPLLFLATYLSSMLTGQTGVNPMEVFAILVLLALSAILSPSLGASFLIAGVVAVSAGLAGDVMNDLKSGYLLKTRPSSQLIAEGIGGVVGAIVATFALFVLKDTYGFGPGSEMAAPQAQAVALMVSGLNSEAGFFTGLLVGCLFSLLSLPAATLGLGVYLPVHISSIMGLGALVAFLFERYSKDRNYQKKTLSLISSGFLGGEGITGVLIAIYMMLS